MELILDQNKGNTFCGKEYPVFSVDTNKPFSFEKLKKLAAEIIEQSQNMSYIILNPSHENDMLYLLTVALRLEADKNLHAPACTVLKVSDLNSSLELHKKYIALTVGAVYIARLSQMNINDMLRDIDTLSYLGLNIKTDYLQNIVTLKLNGTGKEHYFNVYDKEKAVLLSALMKTLSLLEIRPATKVRLVLEKVRSSDNEIDAEKLIARLIKITRSAIRANKPFFV